MFTRIFGCFIDFNSAAGAGEEAGMIRKITGVGNEEWPEHTCHISARQGVNTPIEKDWDKDDYQRENALDKKKKKD